MLAHVLASLRALRRRTARWSAGEDRLFHDSLFGAHAHDPFSPSYPGYITIQRFADLAAAHRHGARLGLSNVRFAAVTVDLTVRNASWRAWRSVRVRAPATPGSYVLEIDLVEEGVSWFTRAGTRPLRSPVRVA